MKINTKNIISVTTGLALAAAVALPAFAQNVNVGVQAGVPGVQSNMGWQGQRGGQPGHTGQNRGPGMNPNMPRPAAMGLVTSVSGTSITIASHQGFGSTTATTTYAVDASNATVKKNNATSTVSAIVIGDRIAVQGTVSGTSITATSIIDGLPMMMGGRGTGQSHPGMASSTPPFVGNGQPVVAGTISTINGTSLTVTTTSNVTYTIDASNAKIVQGQSTVALSALTVGEKVIIQGTVNGSSVTASTVIDQSGSSMAGQGSGQGGNQGQHPGFFGGIGSFFKHLFGF